MINKKRGDFNFVWILLSVILLTVSSVSAQESLEGLGTFKIGEDVLLVQLCGDCTFNNITSVTGPINASELITNINMTQEGTKFTFLLDKNNLTIPGTYNVNGVGDKDGVPTIWSYTFEMTKTGETLETSESILYILILIASFLLFAFFFYLAIVIPFHPPVDEKGFATKTNKIKYMKLLSIWFAHGFFVWFLTILLGISNSFLNLEITLGLLRTLYLIFYTLFRANTIFLLGFIMILIYKDILLNKEMREYGKAFIKENNQG